MWNIRVLANAATEMLDNNEEPIAMRLRLTILFMATAAVVATPVAASAAERPLDFNRDIRPILAENCFYCHGQDAAKRQGDLRLDQRDAAVAAGAVVPRDLKASSLVRRIHATDPDEQMPPPKSNRRLSAEQKAILERWIAAGAEYAPHWAFVAPTRPAEPPVRDAGWVRNPIDRFVLARLEAEQLAPSAEADRATLIKRLSIDLIGLPPSPEEVDAFVADRSPQAYERLVDRLLASRHYGERMALPWLDAARYADSNGFQQDGDTWQWIWRDWVVGALNADMPFDQFTVWQLAGDLLPAATVEQKIASGFNRNHLLNGEGGAIAEEQRFVILFDRIDTTATTWLGLTMACAQCHDHKYDPLTTRDYYSLLDAFNRLPESGTPQRFSARIRVAAPLLELPTDENKTKFADFERQIAEAEAAARPIADAAFAAWRAEAIASAAPPAEATSSESKPAEAKTNEAKPAEAKPVEGKPAEAKKTKPAAPLPGGPLPDGLVAVVRKPESERTAAEQKTLDAGLRKQFDEKVRPTLLARQPALGKPDALRKQLADYKADQMPRVMIMSDERPRETAILERGEYLKPKEKVKFATPAFLPPLPADAPPNRLGLARWLMAPEHPLTARVQANRMWQQFFGAGIVKTAEDFGVQSEYPLHGPLLDWLAVEFREGGWSMKAMHKRIVMSATYRQSSRMTAEHRTRDPENRLYGRASRLRMPSLVLRDWALAASGLLDARLGGRPVYPYQPDAVWEALAITKERDFTYPASSGADLYRRSLYTFWRRTVSPANMFDASNRQTCRVRQSITSTPLHALTTLNDSTWVEAARVLAERSMKEAPQLDDRLTHAFRRVACRTPSAADLALLRRAYERQLAIYRKDVEAARSLLAVGQSRRDDSLDAEEHAALAAVSLAILNFDESLTRE